MSGIYYALSIVALFVIIRWCLSNDRIAPNEPTTGLLAMKDNQAKASDSRDASPDSKKNMESSFRDRG
jgi:hypothetical protein